jgi:hypothetical protein
VQISSIIKQAFREKARAVHKCLNGMLGSGQTKKRLMKSNDKRRIIFCDIKGIVHKYFVKAGQTVNSPCYCDSSRNRYNVQ